MREILNKYKDQMSSDRSFLFTKGPAQKFVNARKSYASQLSKEDVLLLVDDTLWGGAKEGLILSHDSVFAKVLGEGGKSMSYDAIKSVSLVGKSIHINGSEFTKLDLVDEPIRGSVVSVLREYINSNSAAESSSSNPQARKDSLSFEDVVRDIIHRYSHKGKRVFKDRSAMDSGKRANFRKACDIKDPGEIIALLDSTLLGLGHDGVAICEDGVVWRNSKYDPVVKLSFTALNKASYKKTFSDLLVRVVGRDFKLNPAMCDLKSDDFIVIFTEISSAATRQKASLSEEDKLVKEYLNMFPVGEENYFFNKIKTLKSVHGFKSLGNHFASAFDQITAVSEEQKNDAYRRDPFAENDSNKKIMLAKTKFLDIASNFPVYINKERQFPKRFTEILQTEYVTLAVYTVIGWKVLEFLRSNVDADEADLCWLSIIYDEVLVDYAREMEGIVDRDFNGVLSKSRICAAFREKVFYFNKAHGDSWLIMANFKFSVYKALFFREKAIFMGKLDDEDEELLKPLDALYGDLLDQALNKYLSDLDVTVNKLMTRLLR